MAPNDRIALDPAWYTAIAERTSRRRFTGDQISADAWDRLAQFVESFKPYPGVRIALVRDVPTEVFANVSGYLVEIQGASALAVVISQADRIVEAGYIGEAFILEATRLGIGTCWVVGSYHPELAAKLLTLGDGEQLVAGTPLGISRAKPQVVETALRAAIRADRRKCVAELAPGSDDGSWPSWAIAAVEATRLAPSGVNGQPWRFRLEGDALVLSHAEKPHRTWLIDCGIAMLHAELGAQHDGVSGTWERLEEPDVARFIPDAP